MSSLIPVQFKLGEGIADRIDSVVPPDQSRNAWMVEAVEEMLALDEPVPTLITADELLSSKKTLMVRLPQYTVDVIDSVCEDRNIKRTVWLLDAMLSKISDYE